MKKRTNPVNLEEIWHLILEDQVFVLQKDRETCVLAPRILRSCMNPDQIKSIRFRLQDRPMVPFFLPM